MYSSINAVFIDLVVHPPSSSTIDYCDSLYWALATMTSTGYGDYSATNVQEMIYASLVMVLGKLLFGLLLGNVASTLTNLATEREAFDEKLNSIKASITSVFACLIVSFCNALHVQWNPFTPRPQ